MSIDHGSRPPYPDCANEHAHQAPTPNLQEVLQRQPSDPVNLFLEALWQREFDNANMIRSLHQTLRQDNAAYKRWEFEKREQLSNLGMPGIDKHMKEKYAKKLRGNLKVAIEESKVLIKELDKFIQGAESVVEEMRPKDLDM